MMNMSIIDSCYNEGKKEESEKKLPAYDLIRCGPLTRCEGSHVAVLTIDK